MSELKRTTAVNIGFNGIAVLSVYTFQFLASIILARLLLPTDYGIVGFALIFVNFMSNFSDFGVVTALVQKVNADDDLIYTGFTLKALASVIAFVVVFSLAPVSRIFNESREIVSALRMLSFGFLFSVLVFLPQVYLTRQLRYRELFFPQVIGAAASSFCAIALAYSGFGYRSIIAGYLLNTLVNAAVLNILRPVKPRLRLEMESLRHILKFGSHILVPGVVTFLTLNADNFVIGTLSGSVQLGYYAIAFNWGSMICVMIASVIHNVLLPTFSKFQHDLKAMKAAYLDSLKYVAFLAIPINLFFMVLGREFLYHILGGNSGRWLPALTTLRILCLYGVFRALLEPLANVIVGIGKPRLFIRTSLLVAVIQTPLLYPALRLAGIEGVAAVVTASYVSQYLLCMPILSREIGVGAAEAWRAVRPALIAFLAVLPVVIFLKMRFESSLPLMMTEILIGGAGYFIIYGILTGWQIAKEVRGIVRHSR